MTTSASSVLAPMVDKLMRRSQLGTAETKAMLGLPCQTVFREAGSYLVREGDRPEHCALLLSGYVYRSKIAGNGARQILSIHARGDLIDAQNGLLGEADHNVQTLSRTELALIPRQALVEVAEDYPALARALWRETLVEGSIFREWIVNVGQRDARQRISHLICEMALLQEAAGLSNGPIYDWPLTQEQLGDATGLTSVHVNRTLGGLRGDGLIEFTKRSLTITDWVGLQKSGDFRGSYLHQAMALAA